MQNKSDVSFLHTSMDGARHGYLMYTPYHPSCNRFVKYTLFTKSYQVETSCKIVQCNRDDAQIGETLDQQGLERYGTVVIRQT